MSNHNHISQSPNIERMFTHLKLQWQAPSPKTAQGFTALSSRLADLMNELQNSTLLAFLNRQFYPEWRVFKREDLSKPINHQSIFSLPETSSNEFRQGFYFCNRLIQLMEDVYLDLDLDTYGDHPDNRGWINLFRHWSWSAMFQASWTISACTFGIRFQRFCRHKLDLVLGEITTKPIQYSQIDLSTLNAYELLQVKALYQIYQEQQSELQIHLMNLHVASPLTSTDQPLLLLPVFNFGYVVTLNNAEHQGKTILMFRVQDHLRKLGLGSAGLFSLVYEQLTRNKNTQTFNLESAYLRYFNLVKEQTAASEQKQRTSNANETVHQILNNPLFSEICKQSVAHFIRMLNSANVKAHNEINSNLGA